MQYVSKQPAPGKYISSSWTHSSPASGTATACKFRAGDIICIVKSGYLSQPEATHNSNHPEVPRLWGQHTVRHFFFLASKWSRWGNVCPFASKCISRSRAIDASMATHRPGKRCHPRIPVRSQAFGGSANLTRQHPTRTLLGGTCLQASGKRGKISVNSARRARAMCRTTITPDLPTTHLPDAPTRNLVQP